MTDIVAELRRLYENDPVGGNWEIYGPESFGTLIFSDASPDLHHTASNHYETADLIVAMHNHLPALLDVVEAERACRRFSETDPAETGLTSDEWWAEFDRLRIRHKSALAALERSGE